MILKDATVSVACHGLPAKKLDYRLERKSFISDFLRSNPKENDPRLNYQSNTSEAFSGLSYRFQFRIPAKKELKSADKKRPF